MDPSKKRRIDENGVGSRGSPEFFDMLTVEDARKIAEALTHDQLLGIVQNALLRHPDVLAAVRSFLDGDVTQRKLFVRGLGWETTTEKLRAIFSTYGELDEAVVILDKATGKSKGYGFITFKHIDGAIMALKEPSKKIDGRMTVSQLASAGVSGGAGAWGGSVGVGNPVDVSLRKIYVANVPYDMPSERLLQHFSVYGEIEEGPLGFDKATGKSKGFALFVYKTAESARASLVDPIKNIDGHQLNCKLAADGKRGKHPSVVSGPVGAPGGNQSNGDANGTIMPGGHYGSTGGMGGPYIVFSGGSGAMPPSGVVSSASRSVNSGSNFGMGSVFPSGNAGPYTGGSNYGGPGGAAYAGGSALGGPTGLHGGSVGGFPAAGSAVGGASIGAVGRVPSLYGLTTSSGAMVSGDKAAPYGLPTSGALPGQPAGALPTSRVIHGSGFHGVPPYY